MSINQILVAVIAVIAGGVIGLSFGTLQNMALRRHERLVQSGKFKSGWTIAPGSMRRTAYLLVALAGVQLLCPLFFSNGTQWWVSGGVVAGYGWVLYKQLRERLTLERR